MTTRTIVTIAALLVRGQEALLLRRHAGHGEDAGMWDLPGGRLLDHEDDIDGALLRVVEEDLGVRPTAFEFYDTRFAPLPGGDPRVDNLYVVLEWEGEPSVAAPDRHDAVTWLPVTRLADEPIVEPRRTLVRSLLGIDPPEPPFGVAADGDGEPVDPEGE